MQSTWVASTVRRARFYRSDLWPFSIELEYFTQRKVYCSTACDGISILHKFSFLLQVVVDFAQLPFAE